VAKYVEEIMNSELFTLRPDEPAELALEFILLLGITGAPVTDARRTVVGHASMRDLLASQKGPTVADRMTTKPHVVRLGTTLDEAGRRMAEAHVHRLIVVDEQSHSVGIVSALDVVAALLGMPVVHPPTFPHFDRALGITWTNEAQLTRTLVPTAPDCPGVFVLIAGAPFERDRVVWSEAARNVRTRLFELLSAPQADQQLARLLAHPERLRFRAAAIVGQKERGRILEYLRTSTARWHGSFGCETEPGVARPIPKHVK
jgi:CBS domain-containing membrane protein